MLLFNVGGYILDSKELSPSFKRTNNVYNFGELETSRSISFNVPATPMNNKIFELANDYRMTGAKAKAYLDCQMQYTGGVENGQLYISKANKGSYDCVFVYGDLYALKALKDAGKIKDNYVLTATDRTGVNVKDIVTPSAANPTFAIVDYDGDPTQGNAPKVWRNASIRIVDLLKDTQTLYGISVVNKTNTDWSILRLILAETKDGHDKALDWNDVPQSMGETVYLYNNIPDWTYIDLIKILAALSDGYITYKNGVVSVVRREPDGYDIYDETGEVEETIDEWEVKELDNVIAVKDVERIFKDWKRSNKVLFKSNDDVATILSQSYPIINPLLEADNTIYEIAMSEGDGRNVVLAYKYVYNPDIRYELSEYESMHSEPTIAIVNNSAKLAYLRDAQPVQAANTFFETQNTLLWTLTQKATEIKLTKIMSLADFNALKENILLWYDGCKWVWTEAQWSKGQAILTLQKYA